MKNVLAQALNVVYPPEKEARLLEKSRKLQEEGLTVEQIAKTFGVINVDWLAAKLEEEVKPKKKAKNVKNQ